MPTLHRTHSDPTRDPRRTVAVLAGVWFIGTLSWWGFAFPPIRQTPPEWLARLQEVCFGTEASGVPKLYGWGALVAGPAGFALLMAVGWGAELRAGLADLWRRRTSRAVFVLALTALAAEMGWAGWLTAIAPRLEEDFAIANGVEPFPDNYPRLNLPLPTFRLLDRFGKMRDSTKLAGHVTLLGFAYGHCSTVCPATVATMRAAARRLADIHPNVVIITLDAWRDTPSALVAIARKWELEPEVLLLSGNIGEVERVLDEFHVARDRNPKTGEIDHAGLTYVVSADGRIAYALGPSGSAWLETAARRAARL